MARAELSETDQFLFSVFDALIAGLATALDQRDEELFTETKAILLKTAALIDERSLKNR